MTLQQLLSPFRRAIEEFSMIEEGDKIAVGLSGGKDSLLLIYLFSALRRFYDKKFEVVAINIDMGFKDTDQKIVEGLKRECENAGIPLIIEKTQIAEILFDIRKEPSPCSLCSKLRRGALNTVAIREGCNKLALGHHEDDMAETFMLSLIYEGRLSSFQPVSLMSRTGITVIRPLIYTAEKNITAFMKDKPILKNPCPADKHTQREYVKNLIRKIQDDIPFAKDRMISAITHPERMNLSGYMPDKKTNPKK
ncbi:MAG: tRNA 2-thiocytidine biosynthesis protein TtcA [Clostridia bacterium]|nr:tRNA 2-thiocytidine biosynthesis protein TtcA [Clostridia bacterium]